MITIIIVIGWIFQCKLIIIIFWKKMDILNFVYHCVSCITFPFNCSVYHLQTSLENKKPFAVRITALHEWSLLFPLKPRILGLEIIIRENKYRKLQCRINERKTLVFIVKPPLSVISQRLLEWRPLSNANFACNVILEAAFLAVEKQRLDEMSYL